MQATDLIDVILILIVSLFVFYVKPILKCPLNGKNKNVPFCLKIHNVNYACGNVGEKLVNVNKLWAIFLPFAVHNLFTCPLGTSWSRGLVHISIGKVFANDLSRCF